MQWFLGTLTALHVVPALFWAGTTFGMARMAGEGAERMAFPQIGSAAVTIVVGAVLWHFTHPAGVRTSSDTVLAVGAASAVVAAGLQASALPAVRRLQRGEGDLQAQRRRIALIQRIGGVLIVVAAICMVTFRRF